MQRHAKFHVGDASSANTVGLLLASGGGDRISIDPLTGRNRYFVPSQPAREEVWFSSSTASAISQRGFEAACRAYDHQVASPTSWFEGLRSRIVSLFGCPGADAILCASGTETEILSLAISRHLLSRPLVNVVIAQAETGARVMQAAAGTHFDASAALVPTVAMGDKLEGWEDASIETAKIEIRDEAGALRRASDVDDDSQRIIDEALGRGRDVQLHVLDTSKAGCSGPTRDLARRVVAEEPDRVVVVVDACQLRCSFEEIREDLEAGFLVMITGSKFAAGPPFCGALLIPPSLMVRLNGMNVPAGLSAYSARHDWPESLRSTLGCEFAAVNIGLGLRWEAALAELEAFAAIPMDRRHRIAAGFGDLVAARVADRPHLSFLDPAMMQAAAARAPTIFPIVSGSGDADRAARIHQGLKETRLQATSDPFSAAASSGPAKPCHLGQPVLIAGRTALRLCLSMPMISDIDKRWKATATMQDALAPVAADLDLLMAKWDALERSVHTMTQDGLDLALDGGGPSCEALTIPDVHASRTAPLVQGDRVVSNEMRSVFDVAHDAPAVDPVGAFRKMVVATGRTPASIAREYAALAFGPGRLSFDDYVRLRLYDDAFVGSADKRQFVGTRKYIHLIHAINYRHQWICLAEDKIASASYFSAYGLPIIPTKAIFASTLQTGAPHLLHTRAALRAFLLDPSNYPMFGKPAVSLQSLGSMALYSVDRDSGWIEGSNGSLGIDAVVDAIVQHYSAGYVFQELVQAHSGLASVIGERLGTLRIVTMATEAGPVVFKAAWKLVGRGNVADNFWRPGNMVAGIDLEGGRITNVAHGAGLDLHDATHHIDSGSDLIGLQVPFWAELKAVAIEGTKLLRNLGLVGWDMGITDKGPVIVEANVMPDMMLVQIANREGILDARFMELVARQKKGQSAHMRGFNQSLAKL